MFSKPSPPEGKDKSEAVPTLKLERQWLAENRGKYLGQWVALAGDRLVASGLDGKEVYDKARALGVTVPFMAHPRPGDDLPFVAGW